jgi:hypothetical protein
MIKKRVLRTGDGTHSYSIKYSIIEDSNNNNNNSNDDDSDQKVFWGWDDKDMTSTEKKAADIYNKVND